MEPSSTVRAQVQIEEAQPIFGYCSEHATCDCPLHSHELNEINGMRWVQGFLSCFPDEQACALFRPPE
jgi:hypothetical protein